MRAVIELSLELALPQGAVAHVCDVPGCHFRGEDKKDILARGACEVGRYLDWCERHGLEDLGAQVRSLVRTRRRAISASGPALVLRVVEEVAGAPIWESGSPAALFQKDLSPLTDADVHAHFRVARAAYQEIAQMVSNLDPEELDARSEPSARSVRETLDHVGNCLWWYCSRLSDDLPEPGAECPPGGLDRIRHLLPITESWLAEFPADRRAEVVVPTRCLTRDPQEAWTHRKACRRQAEHMVEHLAGLQRKRDALLDKNSLFMQDGGVSKTE